LHPAPPHSRLKKLGFCVVSICPSTLPTKSGLGAPLATVTAPEPFALPLLRTRAAEKVVIELRAQHARQLRHEIKIKLFY
jgi:hypothetical protein